MRLHTKMCEARRLAALLAALLFAAGERPVSGQVGGGAILGRVFDPAGAVVPNALITATSEPTGLTQRARTNSIGEYSLSALPSGTYTVTAARESFQNAVRTGVRVTIHSKLALDIKLQLAAVSSVERVVAQSRPLQTRSAETGEVFDAQTIAALPLLTRNFLDLARLTSGTAAGAGGNTLNISANGQREFANSVLVDGVEATGNRNNDTSIRPTIGSVEEFKVLTSGYPAEFGRASGAVVAILTKSGSNQVHGELYEFFRPNRTAARTFFAADPSRLKQHNAGGSVGGPLRKNKTFLFGSYEAVRLRDAFSYLDSVPPSDQILFGASGSVDLSGLKDPLTGRPIPIFDPNAYAETYSAAPFPGNIIPANRISAPGKAVLRNFFPSPTRPGILNGWFENFLSRQSYKFRSDSPGARLDHTISETDRLSGVYHYTGFESKTGDRFEGAIPVAGGGDSDYGDYERSGNESVSLSETHLFSHRWLNEVRLGYTRFRLDQLGLMNGRPVAAEFGAGNVNLPDYPHTSGFPAIYLGSGAMTGGSTYKPLHFLDRNYHLSDQISIHAGAHQIGAGFQLRLLRSTPFFSLFPTGYQYYGGAGLSLTGDPNYGFYDPAAFYYNGGSDVADLLLGLPYSVTLGLQTTSPRTRSWEGSGYVQDSWRVTDRLAMSFGLRYEFFAPWTEAGNHAANFDLARGRIVLAGRGGNSSALVRPDANNFAPRLGLVYRAGAATVLRAGWGLFYSPENDAREDVLTKNYPFAARQTVFNDIYGGAPFAYTLDAGVPRLAPAVPDSVSNLDPAAVMASSGTAQSLYLVDGSLRTGYSQLFHVVVQREFRAGVAVEAGYSGSTSRKLPYLVGDLNRGSRVSRYLGRVEALFAEGSASFHSLQVKASRDFSASVGFLAAYTFGKNLDNGPAPFNLGHNLNAHNQPQDALDLTRERAAADSDVRHTASLCFHWAVPLGKPSSILLGGWQINGIFTARSGLPVNVVRNANDSGFEGLRPDALRNPNLPREQRTLTRYFDAAAFSKVPFSGPRIHALGNAGRNLARGPGLVNLDLSVFKELPLREKFRIQLRFEFFNVSNTPHFANPIGDMSDGRFGSITQTIGNARLAQFAAKLAW